MYLGKIVEVADRTQIYSDPDHPYTAALLLAIPLPDLMVEPQRRLVHLVGEIPSPIEPPTGCRFHTRCPVAWASGSRRPWSERSSVLESSGPCGGWPGCSPRIGRQRRGRRR